MGQMGGLHLLVLLCVCVGTDYLCVRVCGCAVHVTLSRLAVGERVGRSRAGHDFCTLVHVHYILSTIARGKWAICGRASARACESKGRTHEVHTCGTACTFAGLQDSLPVAEDLCRYGAGVHWGGLAGWEGEARHHLFILKFYFIFATV